MKYSSELAAPHVIFTEQAVASALNQGVIGLEYNLDAISAVRNIATQAEGVNPNIPVVEETTFVIRMGGLWTVLNQAYDDRFASAHPDRTYRQTSVRRRKDTSPILEISNTTSTKAELLGGAIVEITIPGWFHPRFGAELAYGYTGFDDYPQSATEAAVATLLGRHNLNVIDQAIKANTAHELYPNPFTPVRLPSPY